MGRVSAAIALVSWGALTGCGELDSGLPPVGTEWQECPPGTSACVTHRIGLVVRCEMNGSWLQVELPEEAEALESHCAQPEDTVELFETEFGAVACETTLGVWDEGCSYECDLTQERCDTAEYGR